MRVKLIVRVSAKDIVIGRRLDSKLCPVARATNRALKQAIVEGYARVSRSGSISVFRSHSLLCIAEAPENKVSSFVKSYDNRETPEPIGFTAYIDIPETV